MFSTCTTTAVSAFSVHTYNTISFLATALELGLSYLVLTLPSYVFAAVCVYPLILSLNRHQLQSNFLQRTVPYFFKMQDASQQSGQYTWDRVSSITYTRVTSITCTSI
jgi:hypothetical protein